MHDLIRKALKSLPADAPEGLEAFMRDFFEAVPDEDIALIEPDEILRTAQTHFLLSKKRARPVIAIEIFQPEKDRGGRTVIDIANDDMAFLVDSAAAEINRQGFLIAFLIHPIVGKKSHLHIRIDSALTDEKAAALRSGLENILSDVRMATEDWPQMRERLKETRDGLSSALLSGRGAKKDVGEYQAFIDYLIENNFTLLGYREYKFIEKDEALRSRIVKDSSLGVLRDERKPAYINGNDFVLPDSMQKLRRDQQPVTVAKTNRRSSVHRCVPMDAIAIKTYDSKGNAIGEKLFLGLFTSVTYSRSVVDIPFLRHKVSAVIERSGFSSTSHDGRALRHILEKYPRDELFQIGIPDLEKIARGILRLQERQRIALYTRKDPFGRYVSCLVYIPRERYETRLRLRLQKVLERELNGICGNFYTSLDDSVFARVMFVIDIDPGKPTSFNTEKLESKLQEAGRAWSERLADAMLEILGREDRTSYLHGRYAQAFPLVYRENNTPKQGVFDIDKIEKALRSDRIGLELYHHDRNGKSGLHLKAYNASGPVPLSDILPLLENMGLRAVSEMPYETAPADADGRTVWIHDFLLEPEHGAQLPQSLNDVKPLFEEALAKIWHGEAESDGLNRLVLNAAMTWREIMVLRACVRYLRQVRYPYSLTYTEKALTDHPGIARLLVDLFRAWHDPANGETAKEKAAGCAVAIDHALEKVPSLDQDRILRSVLSLIDAMLRTNFFQPGEDGQPKTYLSFKLDSKKISDIPDPKPFAEIFVYSPRMEGIHLRGDRIARGGIRWSDRPEDFRTEILGLMKAQMVKNAIIVPMGAKGGFVLKHSPKEGGAKALREEAIACYKILISGLLDITDNRVRTKVVPPHHMVRRDGDDPYLVVAADKGTATFSDIANTLSHQYGFWLGDAFASGGSTGYDHKEIGITARGAWESVKRHFRELNHDTQTQPFDVVGVGDMAGDVFGNGLLQSEKIRLVSAFNHAHIFCDPNPDPAKSFAERKRLFENLLGWDSYDQKKLSPGGRIFSRSEKNLVLSPEIRKRLDIDSERVTPAELIRAMLRARTDLLWFGGIGTFVKATKESHADAGDKSSDALRIDASEIRARVIGEGANLAMTQRARIEYAEKGGRLNTDFIDNSAGVDCSDHEVNIKILFSAILSGKKNTLTMGARNRMLENMTGEVAALVLRDNYQQTQALSLAESQAAQSLSIQAEFIADLEREQGLQRSLEALPDEDTIAARQSRGKGLTRPELSVLLAWSKILFSRDLLESDIPESPEMAFWLVDYFPEPLQRKYEKDIAEHRLAREIVATAIASEVSNRLGPTFVKACMDKDGASAADVARAWLIVRDIFDLPGLWQEIESLDAKVPATVQLRALRETQKLSETLVVWFLSHRPADLRFAKAAPLFREGVQYLRDNLDGLLCEETRPALERKIQAGENDGLPAALARKVARLSLMGSVCDIIRTASAHKADLALAARIYFAVGTRFRFDWLRQQAHFIHGEDRWKASALDGIISELYVSQIGLAARILEDTGKSCGKQDKCSDIINQWTCSARPQLAKRCDTLLETMQRAGTVDLSMLVIAEQSLRALYED